MNSLINFLRVLATFTLSLTENDVEHLKTDFNKWVAESEEFLRKFGLYRAFIPEVKNFLKNGMLFTEEDGQILSGILKQRIDAFVKDTSITKEQLALLKDFNLYFRKDSAPAWKRITNNINLVNEPKIISMYAPEITQVDLSLQKNMQNIVAKLTGRKNDHILLLTEMRDFRETSPKLVEQYSLYRKEFITNYKKHLMKFVRASGKDLLDVKVARNYLQEMGCDYIPKGFIGKINEKGELFTIASKPIAGMLIGEVIMNPKYDPKTDDTYVCSLKLNPLQQLRTKTMNEVNRKLRFDKVSEFMNTVEGHRKKWLEDLNSVDIRNKVCAAMVEIIYMTQARIGGENNETGGEKTFGLSTLLIDHTNITPDGIEFNYPGKKGTAQHHFLGTNTAISKKVISIIKNLIKGRKSTEKVFVVSGKPITASEVNRYVRSIGINVSVHKFRHVQGTKIAQDLFKKHPFKKGAVSQAQAEKWIKEEAKQIGTILHHRSGSGDKEKVVGTTALNAYVDPNVIKKFFTDLNLRVPAWVPKTSD